MRELRVIVKKPNEDAYATTIRDEIDVYREIVGGYIEVVPFGMEHLLVVNESGKLEGLEPNITWEDDIIVGTVILVKNEAPEFGSILPEEEEWMIQVLNKASV